MKTPIEQVREALENVRKAVNDHRPPECVPDFYIGGQLNKALAALKSMEGQSKPLVWMRMSDHTFVSDRVKNDGEGTFQDYTVPLYASSRTSTPRLTADEAMEVVKRHMADNALMFIHSHSYEHPMTSDQNNAFREALTKAAKP